MRRIFETDEDEMIYHLKMHRDTITWLCSKLQENGVLYQRTRGNTPKGDILLINKEDAGIVQEMIRNYHKDFNGK